MIQGTVYFCTTFDMTPSNSNIFPNMKKNLFTLASVVVAAGVLTFTSCKQEDVTAPSIAITGGNAQSQSLPATANNGTWTNPTATATDDEDGDLSTSITVSGTVDPNTKGTYTLTYSVSDAAGNTASQDLVVSIVNDAEVYAGTYAVHDTVPFLPAFNYMIVVTTDNTVNNRIHFANNPPALQGFAYYQNNNGIYASISGTSVGSTVTLPSQTATNIGTDNSTHTFSGNGTVLSTSPRSFNITYTDQDVTNGSTATGCVQTYVKQ
jgi:hypothetical protein